MERPLQVTRSQFIGGHHRIPQHIFLVLFGRGPLVTEGRSDGVGDHRTRGKEEIRNRRVERRILLLPYPSRSLTRRSHSRISTPVRSVRLPSTSRLCSHNGRWISLGFLLRRFRDLGFPWKFSISCPKRKRDLDRPGRESEERTSRGLTQCIPTQHSSTSHDVGAFS